MNTATPSAVLWWIRTLGSFVAACLLAWTLPVQSTYAQSFFDTCPDSPNANNATGIVVENVQIEFPDGNALVTGDEIAFFTSDDICAGGAVWDADAGDITIPISGPSVVPSEVDGYEVGDVLMMRVWQQSTDRLFDVEADLAYETCDPADTLCNDDGIYENNAIYTITEIGSGVLPVELASFTLQLNDNTVEARWRTLSETDNSGFTLEHRLQRHASWSALGFIPGAGTTSDSQNYSFSTEPLPFGMHYFRLLQHDHDGTTSVIADQRIEHRLTETPIIATLAPQPVRSQATLTVTTAEQHATRIELFDVLGRRLRTLYSGTLTPSDPHTITLSADDLSPGQYIIRIQSGPSLTTRRMVVVR
ncbi:MAG: T9SS type A sorting domain-containing protein [Longimonas sp.]|uniref:T9SS type A sorting domain-containing protein n=1 Tax=Longimonas sp. TaxID=2039626 RepID=UPI00335C16B4